jgi:hypothetical protein
MNHHTRNNPIKYQSNARLILVAGLAISTLLGTPAAAQSDAVAPIVDQLSTPEDRLSAAKALLRDQGRSDLRLLNDLLGRDAHPSTRLITLEAIAVTPSVAEELDETLIGIVGLGLPEERPMALRALASTSTQRAARVLVNHAAPFMPDDVSEAAFDGLIRMTGRADLGRDHDTWREWFDLYGEVDPVSWRDVLLEGLRSRNDVLSNELDSAVLATTDIYKRHFRVVPFQDRDGLLAEMLRAGGALQALGVELLYREIASNRQIGESVGEAALEMLASPSVETRIEAARIITTLRPPQAGTRLTRALEIETEPEAAKALLAACARWPRVASVQPALEWLEFGSETRDEACAILFALDSEGLLTGPADRRRVAAALRAAGPAKLTPDGLRLMVLTGNELDREAVASLIDDPDAASRGAAAAALARRPEFAGRVIQAATLDPVLYPAAVTAVATHRPTPQGYASLRQIQAPTPAAATAGLLAVARAMQIDQLLTVARTHETDPQMRVAILSTVGTASATPEERELINETKLLLAETQLELADPEPALASLAQVVSTSEEINRRATQLRVTGLLWLNRIEEADALNAGAEAWLAALDRFPDEPHAVNVARATLDRFDDVLRDDERNRLNSIVQLAEQSGDVDTPEPTGG